MLSKALCFLLTCLAGVQAGQGANNVVDRDLAPKPVPTSTEYFNVINLFSYDQPLAVQANAIPGGAQNAQDSFIQFYLNDQGNGRNGGCQLTWDPQENEGPPINLTQKLEFDGYKTATLRSYQPPGDFVVDIKHELRLRGTTFIREGTLNISTSDPEWNPRASSLAMLYRSHAQPCNGRIPSSLLQVYVRYKQDTRAIVAWLISHAPKQYSHSRALSVQDLFCLAREIRDKAVSMPENIAFHFREAIAARTQLSNFFRKARVEGDGGQQTLNHEYFTLSLTKIYADLCEFCDQPKDHSKQQDGVPSSLKDLSPSANPFTTLETVRLEHDCSSDDEARSRRRTKSRIYTDCQLTAPNQPTPSLADDALSDAFELSKDIQEMDDLLAIAKDTWEQVALGKLSLVVAASITNAVFAAFEVVEGRLKSTFGSSDPDSLRLRFLQAAQCLGLPSEDGKESSSTLQQMLEALNIPWTLLTALQSAGPKTLEETVAGCRRSSQLLLRKSEDSVASDTHCLAVMVQDIARLTMPGSSCIGCKIIRLSSPVYPDLGYHLTHDKEDSNGLRCCYGLRLLLESYKSCLLAPQTICSPSTCRLHALRFAQAAISNTRAVLDHPSMPCRCYGTLAYHIENLNDDLKAFIHSKMFDFYFQAPWTCGCHELSILDALFYYGLRLFSYRNYVGSVIHTYNALRQLSYVESIPLLDSLADAFRDILFPGGCPRRNFKACWIRFMGARLRFKSHTSSHKSGCHSMAIPPHTAQATAGFGSQKGLKDSRFDYRKISILHHIRAKGYHLDDSTWSQICNLNSGEQTPSKATKPKACCRHRRNESQSTSGDHRQRLQCLQEALHAECNGRFPVAKINLFSVYLSCVQIVSTVSDKGHGDRASPGQSCLCFADTLLAAADRCRDNERTLQPLGCSELIKIFLDAMKEALDGKALEDFLWDFV